MRPRLVIVVQVTSDDPPQVSLVQNDQVVETLAMDRSNQPFNIRAFQRRAIRDHYLLDTHVLDSLLEEATVYAVAVEPRGGVIGKRFDDLLSRPLGRRMRRDVELDDQRSIASASGHGGFESESAPRGLFSGSQSSYYDRHEDHEWEISVVRSLIMQPHEPTVWIAPPGTSAPTSLSAGIGRASAIGLLSLPALFAGFGSAGCATAELGCDPERSTCESMEIEPTVPAPAVDADWSVLEGMVLIPGGSFEMGISEYDLGVLVEMALRVR